MAVVAKPVHDPRLGRRIRGDSCFVCRKPVFNYQYKRFQTLGIFIDEKFKGFCHQACYEKWNPKIGYCHYKNCGRAIRRRDKYERHDGNVYHSECYTEKIRRDANRLIHGGALLAMVYNAPFASQVYLCYSLTNFVYSAWGEIYSAYKEKNEANLSQSVYSIVTNVTKDELTRYQTDIIWDKINTNIPEDLKEESKNFFEDLLLKISDKEIEIVKNALEYI